MFRRHQHTTGQGFRHHMRSVPAQSNEGFALFSSLQVKNRNLMLSGMVFQSPEGTIRSVASSNVPRKAGPYKKLNFAPAIAEYPQYGQ